MSGPRPRPHPHPLALFSLRPLNERAENVVVHPCNSHLTSILSDGSVGLDIGFQIRSKSYGTLATLGRGADADIFVEGSSIAKLQCSFEIQSSCEFDSNRIVIMLYDRSHGQTTQVYGDNAIPFEHGRSRKILVQEKLNTVVGMGGVGKDLVVFELEWQPNAAETMERTKSSSENLPGGYAENPRLARTVDDSETVLPSRRETRTHTPGHLQPKIRHKKLGELGSGQFGTVYKAINVDTGKLVAVKVLQPPEQVSKLEWWRKSLKREVEILSQISHPHIVDYIASECLDGRKVQIVMGYMKGSLDSLVQEGSFESITGLAQSVLNQMLQALDCLAANDIIHRDVKPDNILWTGRHGHFIFQLGDFGLCNCTVEAVTFAGTPIFMAPEFFQGLGQTHKADVWSLFVTILWTLDLNGFRKNSEKYSSIQDVHRDILNASSNVDIIQEMARVDPNERASAAQMLVKCFNAKGLTTPLERIPELPAANIEFKTATKLPPVTTPRITYQDASRRPRNLNPNRNLLLLRKSRRLVLKQEAVKKKMVQNNYSMEFQLPGQFPRSKFDS
ncbi:serine/threonine protein kinase domain protein [Metarhizium robertsii]|uniref:CAMK kinase n=3 Tax=Opisthokonta TaxID=33154 RepID=A0A0B4GMT1_METGA|nr:serine/threonine protein kinase domain protein [Metarhizium robertsii]KID83908.1 CAMK kinase [Metarhizium guizhouense ARSEF 977]